jgi:hypothetical protein
MFKKPVKERLFLYCVKTLQLYASRQFNLVDLTKDFDSHLTIAA